MLATTLAFTGAALMSGPFLQDSEGPPEPQPAPAPLARAHELEVRELFRSTGDEAAFWAAYSRSGISRVPVENGLVEFRFDLKEIATVLGS